MPGAPIFRLRNVAKRYYARDGRTSYEARVEQLDLGSQDRFAVVAPSGAGKTTLLNMLLLAASPTSADEFVMFDRSREEVDIMLNWRQHGEDRLASLRHQGIAFMLQSGGLLPFLTAQENIVLPARLAGVREDPERLANLAEVLSITGLMSRKPQELSVGERQRVAFARALNGNPRILIADEPTAALDRENARKMMGLLLALAENLEICVLVASHDLALIDEFGLARLSHRAERGEQGHVRSCFWRDVEIGEASAP